MAITMDGIFVNGQKATFRPEDILSGDASAYTEEIGTAVEAWMEKNVTGGEQVTDTTLALPGVPADAKKTGDEIGALKEDLYYTTDNLLDFTDGSLWVRKDLDGTARAYSATTASPIAVIGGQDLYTAMTGLSVDTFGNQFNIKIRQFGSNGEAIGNDLTFSAITSPAPIHYTLNENTTKIAVMLTTNNYQKTFTIADLVALNPLIYAGFNSHITNETVYRKKINNIAEIKNNLEKINNEIAITEDFIDAYHQTKNVFDPADYLNNIYMRVVDGELKYSVYSGHYFTTNFIPIASGQHVIASRDGMEIPAYSFTFFDSDRNWLGTLYGYTILANTQAAPQDGYIRLSFATEFVTAPTLMVEITESKSASQYVPYGKAGIAYDNLNPRLTELEAVLSAPIDELFVDEANNTVSSIVDAVTSKCVILSVITDEHYNDVHDPTKQLSSAFYASVRNIKYVNDMIPSNAVIDLGDRTNEGDHDSNLLLQQEMIKALRTTNPHVVSLIGNHDWNGTNHAEVLSEEELYAISQQFNEDYVVRDGITANAYMDFAYAKVRLVFYNTFGDNGSSIIQTMGSTTSKTWLANTALDTPNDYTVVFMSHAPIKDGFSLETIYGGDDVIGILEAYATQSSYTDMVTSAVYDFTDKTGTRVACCISGHNHEDNIYQDDALSFPFVGIGCNKFENGNTTATIGDPSKPVRQRGKPIMDLWDTVVVLPDEKTVKFIRFGAGDDRTVTYT